MKTYLLIVASYVWVMSRADDVINVAAHRLSTGAIEQAIGTHPGKLETLLLMRGPWSDRIVQKSLKSQ